MRRRKQDWPWQVSRLAPCFDVTTYSALRTAQQSYGQSSRHANDSLEHSSTGTAKLKTQPRKASLHGT